MPLRLITALVAALALVLSPAVAFAQKPSATPGPPKNASAAVKRIYEDYRRTGKIKPCEHERADLQDAVDTIPLEFDEDYPDFRVFVEGGVTLHDDGGCDDEDAEPTATATATPTPTATATATASPDDGSATQPEQDATEDGSLPLPQDDTGGTGDGAAPFPEEGTLPEDGLGTDPAPAPSVAPPTAQVAPPVATPTPVATAATVSTSADTSRLLIPAVLVALAIVGALALAFFGRRSAAWREATFRTRATWADFTDWLRLGR